MAPLQKASPIRETDFGAIQRTNSSPDLLNLKPKKGLRWCRRECDPPNQEVTSLDIQVRTRVRPFIEVLCYLDGPDKCKHKTKL